MKSYLNLKKGTKAGLVITAALCILALVWQIIGLVKSDVAPAIVVIISFSILVLLIVLFYALVGYKKPHGNMLRFTAFVYAVYLGINALIEFSFVFYATGICSMIVAVLIAYISGRLDKIEKNKILLLIAVIILFVGNIVKIVHSNSMVYLPARFTPVFIIAFLSFAYIARYEEHKAAGLEDK